MKNIHLYIIATTLILLSWTSNVQAQTSCPDKGEVKIVNPGQVTVIEPNTTTPGTGVEGQASAMSEERMIYWVHGMGGNRGSWSNALTATQNNIVPGYPARKAICDPKSYNENAETIINAATAVQNTIIPNPDLGIDYDNHESILIAHSMGGIVARRLDGIYMDEPNKRKVGGMAFFGSPHLGASGLEDAQERARQFMARSASDLAAYQITSLTTGNNSLPIRFVSQLFGIDSWLDNGTETLFSELGGLLFNGLTSASVSELVEGSATINALNARTTSIPMIPYYGVFEDYTATTVAGAPIFVETVWASLQYMFQTPNDMDYFTATDFEYELQQTMNGVRSSYIASAISEQAAADEFISMENINNCYNSGSFAGFFIGPFWGNLISTACVNNLLSSNAAAIQRRNAAFRGARWFDTVNDQYKVLIGAREAVSGCECRHDYYDLNSGAHQVWYTHPTSPNGTGDDCEGFSTTYESSADIEKVTCYKAFSGWVEHPSDGLLLASSASGLPTHLTANNVLPRVMQGSSHFGMRNDENLMNELILLFNGGVDPFFQTDEK